MEEKHMREKLKIKAKFLCKIHNKISFKDVKHDKTKLSNMIYI